jgi:hypothetical protein
MKKVFIYVAIVVALILVVLLILYLTGASPRTAATGVLPPPPGAFNTGASSSGKYCKGYCYDATTKDTPSLSQPGLGEIPNLVSPIDSLQVCIQACNDSDDCGGFDYKIDPDNTNTILACNFKAKKCRKMPQPPPEAETNWRNSNKTC